MGISAEEILAEIGPIQEVLDAHEGVVTVLDTSDGNIMLSLDGECTGCSSTPMTAMQIYYSLKKLDAVNDVIFVNGELPEYNTDDREWSWKIIRTPKRSSSQREPPQGSSSKEKRCEDDVLNEKFCFFRT